MDTSPPLNVEEALAQIKGFIQSGRAEGARAYHKVDRVYLGVPNPELNSLTTSWRRTMPVDARVTLAQALWETNIFEARVAAAKLLTQARIRPDEAAWDLIASWRFDFDSWAIADHACMAGQKRVVANPERLDEVERWTTSDSLWIRRAALVITLPWTKQNNPKHHELATRDRILGWAAQYVEDPEWFIQKAVAWWLRDLSRHDPARVIEFLNTYGDSMKPFARKEAAKHLPS